MPAIFGDPGGLVAEIRRRAQQKAVDIEEAARKQSAGILSDATKERESIRTQFEQQAERELALLLARSAARGELEARRRFTIRREALIDSVWRAAEARLRELVKQPRYIDILRRIALQAGLELGGSEFVLAADPAGHELLSPATLERWSREAAAQFRRAPNPAPAWGGLLVSSGRNRVDATFPTRLSLARLTLRELVFQILSKEGH